MQLHNKLAIISISLVLLLLNSLAIAESNSNEAPFEVVTVKSGGEERQYRMVVPKNYDPERPVGVLFGYHGGGPFSFLIQLRDLGYEALAAEAYWITISVAAAKRSSLRNARTPFSATSFNFVSSFCTHRNTSFLSCRAFMHFCVEGVAMASTNCCFSNFAGNPPVTAPLGATAKTNGIGARLTSYFSTISS